MAKTKTPYFSMGAKGSVGQAITAQKRGPATLLRSKPLPTDPYSLPQAYQRWLYEDYTYLWRQQTNATRNEYRSAGVRHHLTAFQYWMKYQLTNMPDITGFWHLDEATGAIAHDSSRYATNGTIIGATPATGLIDGAQDFTLNDYIRITAPQLRFTTEDFSILMMLRIDNLTNSICVFACGAVNLDGYDWLVLNNGRLYFRTYQAAANQTSDTDVATITASTWFAIGMKRSGTSIRLFAQGADLTRLAGNHLDPTASTRLAKIGIKDNQVSNPMEGIIDHVITYNRALDDAEFLRHSLRRYPSQ